jgi:hypothetical protein
MSGTVKEVVVLEAGCRRVVQRRQDLGMTENVTVVRIMSAEWSVASKTEPEVVSGEWCC